MYKVYLLILFQTLFRQLIYNYPEQLFADAGVMAIEHADFEGVERLALVLGMFHQSPCTYKFFWGVI